MKEKLLKLLYDNAKYTVKDLATMLGVSEAEVASEISALEKEGVICGYKTLLNWEKLSSSYLTALI